MLLREILDSSSDVKVVFDGPSHGRKHIFKTQADIGKRSIEFFGYMSDSDDDTWLIEFTQEGELEMTGSGKEFEVFSMVKKSLEMLLDKYHPTTLKFAADKKDKARASLYDKFVKRYMKDWRCETDDNGSLVKFILTKK